MTKALILVDIQNDFLPDGALAVPDGDQVIPVANQLIPKFELVVATQDWHPANHGSFASMHPAHQPGDLIELHGLEQILWPDHACRKAKVPNSQPNLTCQNRHMCSGKERMNRSTATAASSTTDIEKRQDLATSCNSGKSQKFTSSGWPPTTASSSQHWTQGNMASTHT